MPYKQEGNRDLLSHKTLQFESIHVQSYVPYVNNERVKSMLVI